MMELFSEIYGCYFTVVSRILEMAAEGLTRSELEELVASHGFQDSVFQLSPNLFSGEWNVLEQRDGKYYSRMEAPPKRPWSALERAWIKSLISDPRMKLFLDQDQRRALEKALAGVPPLFEARDFHVYDRHLDGDDTTDKAYIACFRTIVLALKESRSLIIAYNPPNGTPMVRQVHPYRICYSMRDDKFRLQCAVFDNRKKQLRKNTLNVARISSVSLGDIPCAARTELEELFSQSLCTSPMVMEIYRERNALERCMLQFASFERQTEYDINRDLHTCRVWYDPDDETELLIRVLSFGPAVKVLEPAGFVEQIKKRIQRQMELSGAEERSHYPDIL